MLTNIAPHTAVGKNAKIDTPSTAFQRQHRDIAPCHDLMGGTESMRRAGVTYIIKEQGEDDSSHQARVKRTVLRNIFAQTVSYSRGQVFSRQVSIDAADGNMTDENLDRFKAWAENVDQRGHNLTAWGGETFKQGLVDGVIFAFVDYPYIETERRENGVTEYRTQNGEWRRKTAAADKAEGWQPYLVLVPAAQVLECRGEWQGNRHILTHFRFIEEKMEPVDGNPWGEQRVQYIRAYWPDHWEVYVKREGETDFTKDKEGRLSLKEIPVAIFMPGEQRTSYTARPALMDLAWLNIRHWQATSEQYDLLSFARRPPWYISGVDETDNLDENGKPKPLEFGPGKVFYLPQGGQMGSAGVNPASIEAGRQDLKDLEEAMAAYGLQLLQTPTGNRTATQVEREGRENNSTLRNWALDFQDFLENCLRLVGLWWGLDDGPSAKVNDDFARNANVEYLMRLYDKSLISKETMANLMTRAGILPDDFDYEDEAARIAQDLGVNGGSNFSTTLSQHLKGMGTVPPQGGSEA